MRELLVFLDQFGMEGVLTLQLHYITLQLHYSYTIVTSQLHYSYTTITMYFLVDVGVNFVI